MGPNLALILGLASGFAFLNIVLVLIWFLWERSRRKRRDQQQNILTYINQRPRKLVKRNRPSTPIKAHTLPEKCDSDSAQPRNMAPKYSIEFSSPSPPYRAQPPREIRHLGLSSLRNELYPASVKRKTSTGSNETGSESVYSTMSAPNHLHEKLLSETHQSFSTVDTLDFVNICEKYDYGAFDENPSTMIGSRHPSRVVQEVPQGLGIYGFDTSRARYRTKYSHETSLSTPLKSQSPSHQWPNVSRAPRQMCSVRPLHPKSSLTPPPVAARQFPSYIGECTFPSRLRSPHSP